MGSAGSDMLSLGLGCDNGVMLESGGLVVLGGVVVLSVSDGQAVPVAVVTESVGQVISVVGVVGS